MKSIRQLIRQPIKTSLGIVLITCSFAVLCVSWGQSLLASKIDRQLNEMFVAVALPAVEYTKAADQWALNYAVAHPEVIQRVCTPGLISAYIPAMKPDNYLTHLGLDSGKNTNNFKWLPNESTNQYTSFLLEITLTELDAPSSMVRYTENGVNKYVDAPHVGVSASFTGRVENIIGLAEGYPNYQGFTVSGMLKFPSAEEFESLELTTGSRCLIYGTFLHDNDWALRCMLTDKLPQLNGNLFDAFDPEKLYVWETDETVQTVGTYQFDGFVYDIAAWELALMRTIYVKVEDESRMPNYVWDLDSGGNPVAKILDYREYPDNNGRLISVTPAEYNDRYAAPTIVRLEGTAEDFIASEENTIWKNALHNIEINSHAFPMIGVENITDIADFILGKADIVQGRSFTEEELARGARVCVISHSLAQLNGLNVGDTLTAQLYENDPGVPYQINIAEGNGCVNPVACFFYENTMDLHQKEEYTIIGLYEQDVEWDNIDNNLYSFTPNTIFVPQTAISVKMDYGYGGFFRTFVLHNGTINKFQQAASAAGFSNMFYFNDNNYSAVEESLQFYNKSVGSIYWVSAGTYVIMMLLFFLLFPIQQRRVVLMMDTIGASRIRQIIHVMMNSIGIIGPGVLLGTAAGTVLLQKVQSLLAQETYLLPMAEMNVGVILVISGVQFIFVALVTLLIAIVMTRRKNLMRCL